MKTSLLLIGLLMGTAAGTAQAADAAPCQHLLNIKGQALAVASTSGNGVLSDLGSLLSGQKKKADSTTTDSDNAGTPTHAAQAPGPAQAAAPHAHHDASHDSASTPMAIRDGGNPPPANPNPDNPPTLGWQSLLPGSIQ